LCDIYRRYIRPDADERTSMRVLWAASLAVGLAGIGMALAMMQIKSALDAWWQLASIFSGGMLGLFLLGLISRRATNAAAIVGVVVGVLVIFWMSLPSLLDLFPQPPELPVGWSNPLHSYLTIVVGTLTIFFVGFGVSLLLPTKKQE
jgi:SSS family solute:Na+ symporter